MTTPIGIQGECAPRFAAVRRAFAENFAERREIGAAVAVVKDGALVVDLWGGHADAARTRPWQRDTLVHVFSTTKGMTTLCAHMLADRGLLDLDAPVARYWPEFAQAGKAEIPVSYVLSHRAGLPAVTRELTLADFLDWDTMTTALAAQAPWWEPGTRPGYHPFTFGWLVGEVVRRVSGKTPGVFFREEVGQPLGIDFHIGLGEQDDARAAEIVGGAPPPDDESNIILEALQNPQSMLGRVFLNPVLLPEVTALRAYRAAEIPAGNGHGTARAVATVYGALAQGGHLNGVRLLKADSVARAVVEQWKGVDAVMRQPGRMGLGFMLHRPETQIGLEPRAFGHSGAGGSVGFADPVASIGFAYVMNQMHDGVQIKDARATALIGAVYRALTT